MLQRDHYYSANKQKIVEIKKVFNWCWNDRSVDAETTVSGSEFQICEAATGKARPPQAQMQKLATLGLNNFVWNRV